MVQHCWYYRDLEPWLPQLGRWVKSGVVVARSPVKTDVGNLIAQYKFEYHPILCYLIGF